MSYLIEKISNAIAIAIKRDFGGSENTIVEIDPAKNRFYVAVRKNVVEESGRSRKPKSPLQMQPNTAKWHTSVA